MHARRVNLRASFAVAAAFAMIPTCGLPEQPAKAPPEYSGSTDHPTNGLIFAKLSEGVIADFKGNPAGLLVNYASAGLPLSTRTRDLVLSENGLVDSLIAVAKNGNPSQQSAMGTGVAEAARLIARTDPKLAAAIQLKVMQSGLLEFIAAFAADSTATGSTGGGGDGGGGGGGTGQVGGVNSGGGSGGGNSGSNSGGNSGSANSAFTGSGVPGGSGFAATPATGGSIITTTTSVSPSS